jgi:hypothetical protein
LAVAVILRQAFSLLRKQRTILELYVSLRKVICYSFRGTFNDELHHSLVAGHSTIVFEQVTLDEAVVLWRMTTRLGLQPLLTTQMAILHCITNYIASGVNFGN